MLPHYRKPVLAVISHPLERFSFLPGWVIPPERKCLVSAAGAVSVEELFNARRKHADNQPSFPLGCRLGELVGLRLRLQIANERIGKGPLSHVSPRIGPRWESNC